MKKDTRRKMVCFAGTRRALNTEYVMGAEYNNQHYNPLVRLFTDVKTPKGVFFMNVPVPQDLQAEDAIAWVCNKIGMELEIIEKDDNY